MHCYHLHAALDPQTMLIVGVLMMGFFLVRFLLQPKLGTAELSFASEGCR